MVENRVASASNASAAEGPEDTNAGTKEPADDAAGGKKFIGQDALQQMVLDSLSERNQVLRDLRDRYDRGEGDFPYELFGRWSCSIVTLKADLEAQDDEELIKDLEAAGFFKDDDMINRLSTILAQRLFTSPPPGQASAAGGRPAQGDPRTRMQRAVQVLTALPATMAIAVLAHSPGSPHDKIVLLPPAVRCLAALSLCPGLAPACAVATGAPSAPTGAAGGSPGGSHGGSPGGGAAGGSGSAPFTICVEIKQPPTAAVRSSLAFDSGGPCEGAPGESDMGLACMEDVSAERLWIWSQRVTAADVAEERARRAALGMDACDEDPESQFTLKRRVGSMGCTLTCSRLLGALDAQLPDNLRVVFSSSSGSVNVKGAKFEGGGIACVGLGCEVTFEDVVFDKCSLLVLGGARVTLARPRFQHMAASAAGLSICADGSGTEVTIKGGSINGGFRGVLLQAGAALQASDVSITGVEGTGVEAKDKGSDVTLTNCELTDFVPFDAARHMHRMHAVRVFGGASAQLNSVRISGACFGVELSVHASAELANCAVSSADVACVRVRKGGAGTLTDCTLQDAKECGLCVHGADSCADAHSCKFVRNSRGCGAHAGGVLAATGCESSESERGGYYAADRGALEVSECASVRDGAKDHAACGAEGSGTFTGRKVAVSGSRGDGFRAEGGGSMNLKDCSAVQCEGSGVSASGMVSQIVAEGCTVDGVTANGVSGSG